LTRENDKDEGKKDGENGKGDISDGFEGEELKTMTLETNAEAKEEKGKEKRREITGAAALIESLEREGVQVAFGVIGGAIMPVYDELGNSHKIRHITTAHEQGAIHAADGYARVKGEPGVCMATSGPGAANLVTGIATAYMDSAPLMIFTGQVPTDLIGRDSFQEVDIRGMSDPVTKHNYLVRRSRDLPRVVREGFHLARTGRPGPILVDLPKDVQTGSFIPDEEDQEEDLEGYRPRQELDLGAIEELAEAIERAEKPLIIAGGGVISAGAGGELADLVQDKGIPIAFSLMGLGAFPVNHPLSVGMLGMHGTGAANKAVTEADLVIAVGTRLDDRMTGDVKRFAPNAEIAHIDIDPSELGKIIEPDIPIAGDARATLQELKRIAAGRPRPETSGWIDQVKDWKGRYSRGSSSRSPDKLTQQEVVAELSRFAGEDTIITTGVGQHQMWAALEYDFTRPRTLITSGGLGTMGYGFPAALGAKVAAPDRPVICVTGDGSFQMNVQELVTAVRENLDVTVVLMRNGYLGMVRQWQELFFDNRTVETEIGTGMPSMAKVTEAYGGLGLRVEKKEDLSPALRKAASYRDGPSLIECVVAAEENVFPMVPAGRSNEEFVTGEKDV